MNYKQSDKKTIRELQATIRDLEARVEFLSRNEEYGILNRRALELDLPSYKQEIEFVTFLDVDYLHDFNKKYGHDEANNRIRRALHFRSSDLVLAGRWYSGDEIVILGKGDPEGFCQRVRDSFSAEGMSVTIAWSRFTGNLEKDVARAKSQVDEAKAARGGER